MLKILSFLTIIFILTFVLLLWFLQHERKKDQAKENFITLVLISILFSLIITVVIAVLLFIIIGSTNVVNSIFSLDINSNQLIVIGISFLIYWLTIDNIFEKVFQHLFGENMYPILFLSLSRVASFYIIGILLKLNEVMNLSISVGVSIILLAIDLLYYFKDFKSN